MAPLARSAGLLALLLVSFCPCSSVKDTRYDSFHVVSEINARFSSTRVRSVLSNLGNDSKELTFTFQLPETALISGFTMWANVDADREGGGGYDTKIGLTLPIATVCYCKRFDCSSQWINVFKFLSVFYHSMVLWFNVMQATGSLDTTTTLVIIVMQYKGCGGCVGKS